MCRGPTTGNSPYKGKATGFERSAGRAYETKMPQLGEMVFALIPVDKGAG